jgi:hypothetical protein
MVEESTLYRKLITYKKTMCNCEIQLQLLVIELLIQQLQLQLHGQTVINYN